MTNFKAETQNKNTTLARPFLLLFCERLRASSCSPSSLWTWSTPEWSGEPGVRFASRALQELGSLPRILCQNPVYPSHTMDGRNPFSHHPSPGMMIPSQLPTNNGSNHGFLGGANWISQPSNRRPWPRLKHRKQCARPASDFFLDAFHHGLGMTFFGQRSMGQNPVPSVNIPIPTLGFEPQPWGLGRERGWSELKEALSKPSNGLQPP